MAGKILGFRSGLLYHRAFRIPSPLSHLDFMKGGGRKSEERASMYHMKVDGCMYVDEANFNVRKKNLTH